VKHLKKAFELLEPFNVETEELNSNIKNTKGLIIVRKGLY
jgi:hypothetical protein